MSYKNPNASFARLNLFIETILKLNVVVMGLFVFFASCVAVFSSQTKPIFCDNITVLECFASIEKEYSISIDSNIDFNKIKVRATLQPSDVLSVLRELLESADTRGYAIVHNDRYYYVDAVDATSGAGPTKKHLGKNTDFQTPMPSQVSSEESKLPEAVDNQSQLDLDTMIKIPGQEGDGITLRQLQQLQDKADLGPQETDASAVPDFSGASDDVKNKMTPRRLRELQNRTDTELRDMKEFTMPNSPDDSKVSISKLIKLQDDADKYFETSKTISLPDGTVVDLKK